MSLDSYKKRYDSYVQRGLTELAEATAKGALERYNVDFSDKPKPKKKKKNG